MMFTILSIYFLIASCTFLFLAFRETYLANKADRRNRDRQT